MHSDGTVTHDKRRYDKPKMTGERVMPWNVDEGPPNPHKCIGCGRFLRRDSHWNQCPDCDTREPDEVR